MTIRNLDYLFKPDSVALIGASKTPSSVGAVLARNLFSSGFDGPVIVVKAGRHAEGARAAASHTGALAGSDAVYDAVFRRSGMLRVVSLEELFDAVETLALTRRPKWNRLAIVTNGGGIGVLATDALMDQGGHLAELSSEAMDELDQVLPPTWSHANPVDIIGDAPGTRYQDALRILAKDSSVDAVLVLNCPTAVAPSEDAAVPPAKFHSRAGQGPRYDSVRLGRTPGLAHRTGSQGDACGIRYTGRPYAGCGDTARGGLPCRGIRWFSGAEDPLPGNQRA